MINKLLSKVQEKQFRTDLPDFKAGDTIAVGVRITEGAKSRVQTFEGLVLSIGGEGLSKNFIVRKFSSNISVERTFPIHSPIIESIKVIARGKVRRNKLYYMRDRRGKAARVKDLIKR